MVFSLFPPQGLIIKYSPYKSIYSLHIKKFPMFTVIAYSEKRKKKSETRFCFLKIHNTCFKNNSIRLKSGRNCLLLPLLFSCRPGMLVTLIWQIGETRTQSLTNLTNKRKITCKPCRAFWNFKTFPPVIQTSQAQREKVGAFTPSLSRDGSSYSFS